VRAPGQERPAPAVLAAAARRDSPQSSGSGEARSAQRPIGAGGDAQPARMDGSSDIGWTIAAALCGLVAIILGAIVVGHGRAAPKVPEWSRRSSGFGPTTTRSGTPVTLSRRGPTTASMLSRGAPTTRSGFMRPLDAAVTLPNLKAASKESSVPTSARHGRPKAGAANLAPDAALDTLLEGIDDADFAEVRAVREAHAAARRDLEQGIGGNAILQAIDAAERDLLLNSPEPTDTDEAMGHSLDDDLLPPKRRPGK
jgi:hypothetical protein